MTQQCEKSEGGRRVATDGGLRKLFRRHLRAGFHWQSVETGGTGLGVPDSNFCCDGVEGWVEFKQTTGWQVTLRPEQVAWLVRRAMVGGRVFVAVRRRNDGGPRRGDPVDELWLLNGARARELEEGGLRAGLGTLVVSIGGPARWRWDLVRAALL